MDLAIEAGADDVRLSGTEYEITCDPEVLRDVSKALEDADLKPDVTEITRLPKDTVDLDAQTGRKVLKLLERLDDHDDVQNVSANYNIPDDAMAEIGEE